MSNEELFAQLEEDENNNEAESSEEQFKGNFDNLNYDIDHIDQKLQNIQGHITVLESKLQMIDGYISKNKNNATVDLGKSFGAFNKAYELLSFMQKSYQVYMDLKYKYRTEQNGLKYKLIRMDEIDKKRMDEVEGLNKADVVSAMAKFMTAPQKKDNVLKELENDPKYAI
jgi:hypothetical protein